MKEGATFLKVILEKEGRMEIEWLKRILRRYVIIIKIIVKIYSHL